MSSFGKIYFFTLENAKKNLNLMLTKCFLSYSCAVDTMRGTANKMHGAADTMHGAANKMCCVADMMLGAANTMHGATTVMHVRCGG